MSGMACHIDHRYGKYMIYKDKHMVSKMQWF